MTVANLRTAAGKDPHDKGLHDLVGELSTRSDDFRRRWGAHNVRTHGTGVKHFHHHIVGDLTLAYESIDLRAEPGPHHDHLRRRTRLPHRRRPTPARLLGRHHRSTPASRPRQATTHRKQTRVPTDDTAGGRPTTAGARNSPAATGRATRHQARRGGGGHITARQPNWRSAQQSTSLETNGHAPTHPRQQRTPPSPRSASAPWA